MKTVPRPSIITPSASRTVSSRAYRGEVERAGILAGATIFCADRTLTAAGIFCEARMPTGIATFLTDRTCTAAVVLLADRSRSGASVLSDDVNALALRFEVCAKAFAELPISSSATMLSDSRRDSCTTVDIYNLRATNR